MSTNVEDRQSLSKAEALGQRHHQPGADADNIKKTEEQNKFRDNFYTPNLPNPAKASVSLPLKLARRVIKNKKQAYGAGSIVGLLLAASLVIASFGSGPLELIHLSQILHLAHFAEQEAAGDGRLVKALRNMSKTGANAGDTEISEIVDTYHGEITADLAKIGITPKLNPDGTPSDTLTVDTTEGSGSPYSGMTPQEAADAFTAKTGITPKINGTSLEVSSSDFWGSPNVEDNTLGSIGLKGVAMAARARFMNAFGLSSMHPLHATNDEDQEQADQNFESELKEFVDTGKGTISADTIGAAEEETVDGKVVTTPDPGDIDLGNESQTTSLLEDVASSGSLKTAGSTANLVAVTCALQMIYNNRDSFKLVEFFKPAMRLAMVVMSIGYQIMSGQDVSTTEVGAVVKNVNSIDAAGKTTDGLFDSKEMQSAEGNSISGVPDPLVANGTYNALESSEPGLSWTGSKPISDLCSPVGEDITTGVTTVAAYDGSLLSLALKTIISGITIKYALSEITHLLSGNILDPTATGSTLGANADYGALGAADETAIHAGAGETNTQESGQLSYLAQQQAKQAFDSESFVARVFDINNYQSLAGRLADDVLTSNALSSVSGFVSDILSSTSVVARLPFTIFSSIASAAAPQSSYAYPFPEFNFTEADLNNSAVGNPYKNASYVANLLDTSCLNNDGTTNASCGYISQAESCFGDEITKDNTDHVWDVIPNQVVNFDSSTYNTALCDGNGPNDTWLKVRFFILDTGVIEGYACADLNDPVACSDDGTTGNDTNTEASNTSAFTGATPSYDTDMASLLGGVTW